MSNNKYYQDQDGQWWYGRKNNERERAIIRICPVCGKEFPTRKASPRASCSHLCMGKANREANSRKGKNNHNWKGGGYLNQDGYRRVYAPGHPFATRNYCLEHRLVMEKHLGRYLRPEETVHHKNGIRGDNRLENLELWVKHQPKGQRVSDLVEYAKYIVRTYGHLREAKAMEEEKK